MNDFKSANYLVRPITSKAEDAFDIKPCVVDKIIKIIETTGMGSFSIALAGELGIGKSSCLNLLSSELKSRKIITINFDPFALGKSEVSDIIELFYLKLYAELPSNKFNKIKGILRKSIRSIALLTRMKLSLGAGFHTGVNGDVKVEMNPGDNLSDLLDLWEEESPEQINDQIDSLAKALKQSKKKIVILIDEVDRLPAQQIINFLMFCRLLEKIDNLFSVVAVDYKQIIQKLTTEDGFHFLDYSQAQNYLDKFFQFKLQVHHNKYTILQYAISKLRELDKEKLIIEVTEDGKYEEVSELEKIVNYLGTPRKINKWLVSLHIHYSIIKYAGKWKRDIIALLAGITVHPVFLDYLSLHTLAFVNEKNFLAHYIKDKYGIDFYDVDVDYILLASLGLPTKIEGKAKEFSQLKTQLKVQGIFDNFIPKYLTEVLKNVPHLVGLIVGGYTDEIEVHFFDSFAGKNIDEALKYLKKSGDSYPNLAYELADLLKKDIISPKYSADINLLNSIWGKYINDDFSNPYETIVLFAATNLKLEDVILHGHSTLSEALILSILSSYGIKNKHGYGLDKMQKSFSGAKILKSISFKGTMIQSFGPEILRQILEEWLKEIEKRLSDSFSDLVQEPRFISVFYRFIQFNRALGNDKREYLTNCVLNYINKCKSKEPVEPIRTIREEIKKSTHFDQSPPLEVLFNNNSDLSALINK